MKKVCILLLAVLFVFSCTVMADGSDQKGPAPNAGDGVPDGSGMEPGGPDADGYGPAPNAGDGVPDGSGMDPPNNPDD